MNAAGVRDRRVLRQVRLLWQYGLPSRRAGAHVGRRRSRSERAGLHRGLRHPETARREPGRAPDPDRHAVPGRAEGRAEDCRGRQIGAGVSAGLQERRRDDRRKGRISRSTSQRELQAAHIALPVRDGVRLSGRRVETGAGQRRSDVPARNEATSPITSRRILPTAAAHRRRRANKYLMSVYLDYILPQKQTRPCRWSGCATPTRPSTPTASAHRTITPALQAQDELLGKLQDKLVELGLERKYRPDRRLRPRPQQRVRSARPVPAAQSGKWKNWRNRQRTWLFGVRRSSARARAEHGRNPRL